VDLALQTPPARLEIPEAQRPGTYLKALVSPQGILGFVFLPLLVVALVGNGYVLADAFAIVLNRLPEPLVRVAGMEVTDLFLFGLLLSVALLILSGVLAETGPRQWVARILALCGIASIFVVEYWSAWERGYRSAEAAGQDPVMLGAFNVAMAVGTSTTETLAGFWTIHRTIIPAAMVIPCAVGALVRHVAFAVRRFGARRRARPKDLGIVVRLGALLDAVFDPLRALDDAIAWCWQRRWFRRVVPDAADRGGR
jgi:hypothetical protein